MDKDKLILDNNKMSTEYDILIVGAGLAGLHCALRLSQAYPKKRIAMAEAYTYIGGRVFTYKPNGFPSVHWESGAGRIHTSHRNILSYIDQYKLTTIPIPSNTEFISENGEANGSLPTLYTTVLHTVSLLPAKILATYTLAEIILQVFGKEKADAFLHYYPYRAEVATLRADLGLQAFKKEMGSSSFVVVKEGLGVLIDSMVKTLKKRGVAFLLEHRLTGLSTRDQMPMCLLFNKDKPLYAKRVILALHAEALRGVTPFKEYSPLKHLTMCPLLRTYAIFPVINGKSWFYNMPRIVTDSRLRHIIPVNQKKGVIMTSYTDSKDTEAWKDDSTLSKEVIGDLRKLLPEKKIPAPLLFKSHLWKDGCSYWLPGLYDPAEVSLKIMQPLPMRLPYVFVCGESYSMKQAWMEGAIEHAEAMLQKYFFHT